ncbi:hypothetical protein WR25_09727 [Diploscapter pachys]|uniref:Uncharacterized protein n=1 Tax=Diploscapter pachys TaxID=2018661 RepID=A0A2A2J476_9BILA|nr:hypothetical protein WR25_09727 [Diploscapter pachys]
MDDLSGETAASQAGDLTGTSGNRPDKQSEEELSGCLKGTNWNTLPNEVRIEIIKQEDVDDGDKLNLLCAYPGLLSVISEFHPHNNANGGRGTEAEPSSKIHIKYSPEEKMFYDEATKFLDSRQPRRIFGLKHDEVMLIDLDSKSEHAAILLDALKSTSTTTRKLYFVMNEVDFQLSLDFVEVLRPVYLRLDFNTNEKWSTLNEVVEAFPDLFKLNELTMLGPVHADGDSLLSHFPKFPPSLCFTNTSFLTTLEGFLHVGHVVKFLKTLVSTKFEKGGPAANALKRIVNWTFETYRTETEEGGTTDDCKLLVELVKGIPPNSIVNLDSETGAVERRIFELHLTVSDGQHVIYVKEEVSHRHKEKAIQLANRIEDFNEILDSPDSSTTSDVDEQSVFILFLPVCQFIFLF